MLSGVVTGGGQAGRNCPPKIFLTVGKLSGNLFTQKFSSKNAKNVAELYAPILEEN